MHVVQMAQTRLQPRQAQYTHNPSRRSNTHRRPRARRDSLLHDNAKKAALKKVIPNHRKKDALHKYCIEMTQVMRLVEYIDYKANLESGFSSSAEDKESLASPLLSKSSATLGARM